MKAPSSLNDLSSAAPEKVANGPVNGDARQEAVGPAADLKFKPAKLTIGLAKKMNHSRGVVDASCHLELELDGALLQNEPQRFQECVRQAFQACALAVNEELTRSAAAKGKAPAGGEATDELLSEVLGIEKGEQDTFEEDVATAAPAKPKTPKPKPQEKPRPAKSSIAVKSLLASLPPISVRNGIILASCPVILLLVWYFTSSPDLSPDVLARRALTSKDAGQRVEAAMALAMVRDTDPTPMLRQVAEKTDDPEVLVRALDGLAARQDFSSQGLFIMHLEHPSERVRTSALTGVQRCNGGALPEGLEFRPDAQPDERKRVARRLRELFDDWKAKMPTRG